MQIACLWKPEHSLCLPLPGLERGLADSTARDLPVCLHQGWDCKCTALHLALFFFFFFQAWFLGIGFRSFVYKAKTLLTASSQLLGLFIFWVVCMPVCPRIGESRGIQFFISSIWVPEDQTKVLRLDDKLLYMLSHLAAHPSYISDVNIHLHMLISEPLKLRCIHVATLPCIFSYSV